MRSFALGSDAMASTSLHLAFQDLRALRLRGPWRILRGLDRSDGMPRVLVVAGPELSAEVAAARLDLFERAHARIVDPRVVRVRARRVLDGRPVAVLDEDAVADGITVRRLLSESGTRFPYAAADGFVRNLREALESAHRALDAGCPTCLGAFSAANLLFDRHGRPRLLGFGANLPIEDANGALDPAMPWHQAPEQASGSDPSPMGDYVALLAFSRSLVNHVDMGVLGRLLRDGAGPADGPLVELVRTFEHRILAELPGLRPSMREAIEVADRIRGLLGVRPDPDEHARIVASLLERRLADEVGDGSGPLLRLGPEARWFALGDLGRKELGAAGRRMLSAMVDRHLLGLREPMRATDLLEVGWPGEEPEHESGMNRVYVTLNRLRKAGLEPVLERIDDGYRLLPETRVQRERDV